MPEIYERDSIFRNYTNQCKTFAEPTNKDDTKDHEQKIKDKNNKNSAAKGKNV